MSADPPSRPSFSPGSRWRIGLDVVLRTVLVLAVAVMANYLAAKFVHRFHWSAQTQTALSSRTLAVLRSVTNRVEVTLYYDRSSDYYPDILALLNEYRTADKNISLHTVDYVRDAGAAEMIKEKYQQFFPNPSDTNLVIFDCGGRVKVFPGDKLSIYDTKFVGMQPSPDNPQKTEPAFERRLKAFNGEQTFTTILLTLANPEPIKAYYSHGHNEVPLTDSDQRGFQKFTSVLEQNYITLQYLNWIGNTGVPKDCNLLIIAAPEKPFEKQELDQLAQYLHEGGRLLVLFGHNSVPRPTGLENLLQPWGVLVEADTVQDFQHATTPMGFDIMTGEFGRHPVVNSLSGLTMHVYLPRPVLKLPESQSANAPQVDELFGTTPSATLMENRSEPPHQYPLAVAVEQKPVAGVSNPRGNTRIVVVGDATFLGNAMIDSGGNRDFLNAAVNWLCDRPVYVSGIGPRPVTNFRFQITQSQQRQLSWLLLAALPGGVLIIGWFVWLVRRK